MQVVQMWTKRHFSFLTLALGSFGVFSVLGCSSLPGRAIASAVPDGELAAIQRSHEMPALSARVVKNGATVYTYDSGLRRVGDSQSISSQDKWHLGSCSKSFTAHIIAQLVSEKKLNWSSTVSTYFPQIHPELAGLTIDHLLFHHSEIQDVSPEADADQTSWSKYLSDTRSVSVQREELSAIVLRRAPRKPIGTEFSYANMNYVLLGRIIEKIEGRSWEAAVATRVFDRYGLKSCGIGSATKTASPANEPFGHELKNNSLTPMPVGFDLPPWISPAGLIHCSMADWLKFAQILLSEIKNDHSPFSKELTDQLLIQKYPDEKTRYSRIALGIGSSEKLGSVFNHVGSNGLYLSDIWIAPKADLIVLLATNSGTDAASAGIHDAARILLNFGIQSSITTH